MKILTKPIEKNLRANASFENTTGDTARVEMKLFDPYGRFTYYATSLNEDGDTLFGFAVSPLGPDCDEWGYASLTELTSLVKFGRPRIERDRHFDPVDPQEIRNGARP